MKKKFSRGHEVEVTGSIEIEGDDGVMTDTEFKVVAYVTPGSPGQLYGPPENCEPPEPAEVELGLVTFDDGTELDWDEACKKYEPLAAEEEKLTDKAAEAAADDGHGNGPDPDDEADMRREDMAEMRREVWGDDY